MMMTTTTMTMVMMIIKTSCVRARYTLEVVGKCPPPRARVTRAGLIALYEVVKEGDGATVQRCRCIYCAVDAMCTYTDFTKDLENRECESNDTVRVFDLYGFYRELLLSVMQE